MLGKKAPNFSLLNQDEETINLKDLRGKKVILYFYPKDDTPGCTKEACGFQEHKTKISKKNTVILGVSPDSPQKHTKFREKYDLKFDLLADEDHSVAELYGVWKEKSMYGKKYMGIERSTFVIDENGKIIHEQRNVKVPGHVEEIFELL